MRRTAGSRSAALSATLVAGAVVVLAAALFAPRRDVIQDGAAVEHGANDNR